MINKTNLTHAGGGLTLSNNKNKDRKKFSQAQLNMMKEADLLTLCTSNEQGIPHAIVVEPSRIEQDKIIMSMVQMQTTKENLTQNQNCFLHLMVDKGLADSVQLKITGYANVLKSGKLFKEIYDFESTRLPEDLSVQSIIVFYPTKIEESIG